LYVYFVCSGCTHFDWESCSNGRYLFGIFCHFSEWVINIPTCV
jgi:hypothetical protein